MDEVKHWDGARNVVLEGNTETGRSLLTATTRPERPAGYVIMQWVRCAREEKMIREGATEESEEELKEKAQSENKWLLWTLSRVYCPPVLWISGLR